MYETFVQRSSWKECRDSSVPCKAATNNIVTKSRLRYQCCTKTTEEKLDDMGAHLEANPRKSLCLLALEFGLAEGAAARWSYLLKLQ
jgi:hypothetical protein